MLSLAFAFALASTAIAQTREKTATAPAAKAAASSMKQLPIKVQIIISRYQGEKKISSMPYTLSMSVTDFQASSRANLRMGAKVPVATQATPVLDGKPMPYGGPVQYQDVGTNIDCTAQTLDDGRFRLEISVDDTSVYPDEKASGSAPGNPSFRSFRASDSMILRDGQTAQFTTATDKVSGETVKSDVTLTVVK
jgi:hypothetical protein